MSEPKSIQGDSEPEAVNCPFCGKKDQVYVFSHNYPRVMCLSCMSVGPIGRNTIEALNKWNNRKEGSEV